MAEWEARKLTEVRSAWWFRASDPTRKFRMEKEQLVLQELPLRRYPWNLR